jgi:hypothetical protein
MQEKQGAQTAVHDDEQRELTPRERARVRALLERSERSEWLWSSLRAWAIWIAAIVGGVTVSWEIVVRIVKEALR